MALDFSLATQSVVASFDERTPSPRPANAARDVTVASGAHDIFYSLPNYRLAFAPQFPGVPAGYWRGTSTSYIAFFVESFMDELAASAGVDPVEFRLAHLPADSRYRGVLEHAAERAGWGSPWVRGGRGVSRCLRRRGMSSLRLSISVSGMMDRIPWIAWSASRTRVR